MIQCREWIFRVSCHVNPGESVYVTGSCNSLGLWDPQNLIPLSCELSQEQPNGETIWTASIHLPPEEIEYRFCVCTAIKNGSEVLYAVKRWETNLHPRVIPANDSNSGNVELLSFGYINDYYKVDQGWLVKESAVFLKLSRSNVFNDPIVLWKKKYKNKKCFLKVTPIDITKSSYIDTLMEFPTEESTEAELMELRSKSKSHLPVVEVSVLKENASEFRYQEQFGVSCIDEEFIVFKCRLADPQTIGFLFDYYVAMEDEAAPTYVGCSFVLPSTFKDSYGVTTLPITSPKHIPIGQSTVSYMVVHPLKEYKCNMKVSYARYWKESWRGLAVGHRGAGNSFHSQTKNCANIRENTIASLKYAYEHGADMVEFDVQLSKDLIPVIYHDFHTVISLKPKKESLKTDLMEIPIKDLTLAQLQALKVYHVTEKGMNKFSDDDSEDHQPFPTLQKAMQCVPHSCGFNIEIKWTMRLKDGSYELEHPFELNRFLDNILKVILQSSSPRKIIFSCFHPDICTMIRLKQNLYPILFITQGENTAWPSYDDIRTKTIRHATLFASSADILGINVNTEDLLRDKNKIQMAFDHKQVVFSWGDENSDRDTFNLLKDWGLHGIIFDRVDSHSSQKSSIFLCDDKETCRCFPSSCKPITNGSSNGQEEYQSSPTYSAGETSPASSGKRSPSTDHMVSESSKRIRGDTAESSPLSFCGVLSLN